MAQVLHIGTKFCDKKSNETSEIIWTHFGLSLKQHKYNDVSIYVVSLCTHIAENECMQYSCNSGSITYSILPFCVGKYHGLAKNDALGTNNHKDISAFTTTIQAKLLPTKAFKLIAKEMNHLRFSKSFIQKKTVAYTLLFAFLFDFKKSEFTKPFLGVQ